MSNKGRQPSGEPIMANRDASNYLAYPSSSLPVPGVKNASDLKDDQLELTQDDIDELIKKDQNKRIVIVHGVVHDVTAFAPHHPGGSGVFVSGNGKDLSSTFDSVHGPNAKAKLKNWAIGKLVTKRSANHGVERASASAPSSPTKDSNGNHVLSADMELSMSDIQFRIEQSSDTLILILFGDAYDITSFAGEHPGGMRVLESNNGKECGETFMRIHGLRARDMVKRFFIGHVKDAPACASPLRTASPSGGADKASTMSVTRMRSNSTRLLEAEPLATSHAFRYLTFASPYRMNIPPGGHIKIYSNVDQEEGRFYTPFKTELASFTICAKHYPNGRTSSYLFNLREGDEVFYEGPFPPSWTPSTDACLKDTHTPNTEKHVLLLAGGTGVAPLYTIARYLLQCQIANVTLLFSVQNRDQLILDGELAELEEQYRTKGQCCFSVFVAFSQSFSSASAATLSTASGAEESGRLVLTKANTLYGKIDSRMLRRLPLPRTTHAVAICGPPSFNEAMIKSTVDASVCAESRVHVLE